MKKAVSILVLFGILGFCTVPVLAQNPFTAKPEKRQKAPEPPVRHPIFVKIIQWQHQLKQKMSALIREVRATGDIRPMLFLFSLAFAYGMIHAAGPGHGKFVALSYLVSCGRRYGRAILFGIMIALFHGLSGVVFVLIARMLIHRTIAGSLETAGRITQQISFGLIFLLGVFLIVQSAIAWKRGMNHDHETNGQPLPALSNPFAAALAIGMVPCPAVVLVMLFCLSIGMTGLGAALSFMIAIGMAVTITSVVILGLTGKKLAVRLSGKRKKPAWIAERIVETVASLAIASLGLLFFLSGL